MRQLTWLAAQVGEFDARLTGFERNVAIRRFISMAHSKLYTDFDEAKRRGDISAALDADLASLALSMQGDFVHDHNHPSGEIPLVRVDPGLRTRAALARRCAKSINYLGVDQSYVSERFLDKAAPIIDRLSPFLELTAPEESWIELAPILWEEVATGTRWKPRKQIER